MNTLSPTSYALLGLLALRPWSAYELNQHMQISILRTIWPRAASHIYSEPKQLLARKLVDVETERQGGRQRSVYRINQQGRQALAQWLDAGDCKPLQVESEALLKFLFRALGHQPQLGAEALLEDSLITARKASEVGSGLLADGQLMPEYAGELAELLHLMAELLEVRIRWARQQLAANPGRDPQQRYQEAVARLTALLS